MWKCHIKVQSLLVLIEFQLFSEHVYWLSGFNDALYALPSVKNHVILELFGDAMKLDICWLLQNNIIGKKIKIKLSLVHIAFNFLYQDE